MLELSNLEVVYHSVVLVLKGISLKVEEGKTIALLGPNGAGKTTVLRAITGLLDFHNGEITKGHIRLNGQDLSKKTADSIVNSGIAQVLEGRRIFSDLTVEENLFSGAYFSDKKQIQEDIDFFYSKFEILKERRNQEAGYLSGGEQQMLAISRSLMSRPKILLLDEPSLGLAPKIVAQVADLIRELKAKGLGILLVEQNAQMALSVSDEAYIIENGKVVLEGQSKDLINDPDVKEFYLGAKKDKKSSFRNVKHYKRRKRWLS